MSIHLDLLNLERALASAWVLPLSDEVFLFPIAASMKRNVPVVVSLILIPPGSAFKIFSIPESHVFPLLRAICKHAFHIFLSVGLRILFDFYSGPIGFLKILPDIGRRSCCNMERQVFLLISFLIVSSFDFHGKIQHTQRTAAASGRRASLRVLLY